MNRQAPVEIARFVQLWVAEHLHFRPDLANLPLEIDSLAARLTGDARMHGISGGEIHRTIGDIDTYLTECYQRAAVSAGWPRLFTEPLSKAQKSQE